MLNSLKSQFQDNVALSTRLFDEGVERQVSFVAKMMDLGTETGKQIRSSKNLTEVIDAQKSYVESVQAEVNNLNTAIAAALKELCSNAESIATAAQNAAAETGMKAAATKATTEAAASRKTSA